MGLFCRTKKKGLSRGEVSIQAALWVFIEIIQENIRPHPQARRKETDKNNGGGVMGCKHEWLISGASVANRVCKKCGGQEDLPTTQFSYVPVERMVGWTTMLSDCFHDCQLKRLVDGRNSMATTITQEELAKVIYENSQLAPSGAASHQWEYLQSDLKPHYLNLAAAILKYLREGK